MCRMTENQFRWQSTITGYGRWYVYAHLGQRYSEKLDTMFKPLYSIHVMPKQPKGGKVWQ